MQEEVYEKCREDCATIDDRQCLPDVAVQWCVLQQHYSTAGLCFTQHHIPWLLADIALLKDVQSFKCCVYKMSAIDRACMTLKGTFSVHAESQDPATMIYTGLNPVLLASVKLLDTSCLCTAARLCLKLSTCVGASCGCLCRWESQSEHRVSHAN